MRIGEYELEGELGRGAMGTVYLGRGPDGGLVAVKLLAHVDAASRDRFHREASAMSRVTHPSIVRIRELGEVPGGPYIVTDFLAGGSLLQVLAVHGAQTPGATARVLCDLAEALTALHVAGVIHRDVKPSNVVLSRDGAPLLTDFGVASISGESCLTATGDVVGTLGYTAPELLDGAPATPASDTFGLGVLGYHLLAGRPPFAGSTPASVVTACAANRYPPLASVRGGVPAALGRAIAAALAPDPAGRPADLRLWAQEIRSQVGLEPVPVVGTAPLPGGIAVTRVRRLAPTAPISPGNAGQNREHRRSPARARRLAMAVAGAVLVVAAVAWGLGSLPRPDSEESTANAIAADGTVDALPAPPSGGTVVQAPNTTSSAAVEGEPASATATVPDAGEPVPDTQPASPGGPVPANPPGDGTSRGPTGQRAPSAPVTQAPPPTTAAKPRDAADFNGDSVIDGKDLRQLCDQYGQTGTGLASDLNGNAVVDISDLSILLSRWTGPTDSSEQACT